MKIIIIVLNLFLFGNLHAQVQGWQNLDIAKDSVFGVSTEKAYLLLQRKPSIHVLVAVIDGGVDTAHEDLRAVIWNNPKLPQGDKQERKKYTNDLHGWNFIGGKKGDIEYDNLESTRLVRQQMDFYDSLSDGIVPEKDRVGFRNYRFARLVYDMHLEEAERNLAAIGEDTEKYADAYKYYCNQLAYQLNISYDPRSIVGDNDTDINECCYGNNDVTGPDAKHGTHVAGIIAAIRNNGIGIDGIADNVSIICIRAVPDGDERDKDVANSIRYAVDNGAKIINMSFGKLLSPDKNLVDEAVKYAMSKDVLIVHGAGNDGRNLDRYRQQFFKQDNFPNRRYLDGSGEAEAWIEVGASTEKGEPAKFSNYGKTSVDLFAPGVNIYSTTPGSHYEYLGGTSMAAPMVTGIAALIREYYPKLTAVQVKDIIIKSVIKRDFLGDMCVTGGVVNAYKALKLAASCESKKGL